MDVVFSVSRSLQLLHLIALEPAKLLAPAEYVTSVTPIEQIIAAHRACGRPLPNDDFLFTAGVRANAKDAGIEGGEQPSLVVELVEKVLEIAPLTFEWRAEETQQRIQLLCTDGSV